MARCAGAPMSGSAENCWLIAKYKATTTTVHCRMPHFDRWVREQLSQADNLTLTARAAAAPHSLLGVAILDTQAR